MAPLTIDELIPLEDYIVERPEHASTFARYLERYRQVRIGPQLTMVFENRQTLWFRVHEILRIARLTDLQSVQRELDLGNRLLPSRGRLQAALHIEVPEGGGIREHLAFWRDLRDASLQFHIGSRATSARLVTSRPEDRCFGTAHWVEFALDDEARTSLADRREGAFFSADHREYRHQSGPLSETVRQSLLDDLKLSERDRAA
jgi:hypothetical protein